MCLCGQGWESGEHDGGRNTEQCHKVIGQFSTTKNYLLAPNAVWPMLGKCKLVYLKMLSLG